MSDTFDVAAVAAKAMATELRSARLAGGSRPLSDTELAERYPDEPLSDDVLAAGAHQDAVADRLYDEPSDRTLDDELPPGYDPKRWSRF